MNTSFPTFLRGLKSVALHRGIALVGVLFLLGLPVRAQLAYEGSVLDAKTGKPIPFVNIGVVGRGIGTVSDADGKFLLQFRPKEVGEGDVLRISSLGYQPREVPLGRLNPRVAYFTFRLQPDPIALREVVVTDKALMEVEETHGYPDLLGKGIGYWKDSVALGGELASRIRLRKGLYRLNSLFFHILDNPSDSLLLRINLYSPDSKAGIPGENLNKSGRNILYTLPASKIFSVIDLRPYDLWARNDVIVSLELLAVHGSETVGLSLPAGRYPNGKSFRRYASQDS
ncbi:MAG: carboxypeptidase-like regulatory domain-containing protein, partial [Robiginitalea sp.]|nr:carboxypeptidase-like regulatory domain-containing protein [Robiginitalea sp.]